MPATLQITFLTADMAEMATWVRGVTRQEARVVTVTGEEPLALFRAFVTVVALTRSIVERLTRRIAPARPVGRVLALFR